MADNPPNIGHTPIGYERDAIHVAVVAVVAHKTLAPGVHVGADKYDKDYLESKDEKPIGIVDPFRKDNIKAGDMFWLMLYPGTVQSLRHHWVHPALGEVDVEDVVFVGGGNMSRHKLPTEQRQIPEESITYLHNIASAYGISYEAVIRMGYEYIKSGDYFCIYDSDAHSGDYPEYWEHWEAVTGDKAPSQDEHDYIPKIPVSCSC